MSRGRDGPGEVVFPGIPAVPQERHRRAGRTEAVDCLHRLGATLRRRWEGRVETDHGNVGMTGGKPWSRLEHVHGVEPHEGEPPRQRPFVALLPGTCWPEESGELEFDVQHAI